MDIKKIYFIFSILILFASCQKKQYATFQRSSMPDFSSTKKVNVSVSEPVFTANNTEKIDLTSENQFDLLAKKDTIPIEPVIVKQIRDTTIVEENSVADFKTSEPSSERKANAVNEEEKAADKLALLSLIFGSLGTLIFGPLFAIPALILGQKALRKGTKKRTMAKLGIAFGLISIVITILAVLLAIVFFSALFSSPF